MDFTFKQSIYSVALQEGSPILIEHFENDMEDYFRYDYNVAALFTGELLHF